MQPGPELAATYLLLAGQVSRNEVLAGLGASVIAAVYAIVAHRTVETPFGLRLRWMRVAMMVVTSLLTDTARVAVGLVRAAPGKLVRQPPLPAESGARAVAILALSLAPNSFVARASDKETLLHQMVPVKPQQPPT